MSDEEKNHGKKAAADAHDSAANAAQPHSTTMMPDVNFSTFILSLASSALMCLGEVPDPESGETRENLPLARHTINILSMLDEKIKNGLTPDESRLLEGVLYEVRMKYVMKNR